VELIDTEGKRHTIPRDEIDEMVASKTSLMPEGFEKQLTEVDLSNLLAFLTQRGRFLPLPLNQAATVVTTLGMYHGKESVTDRMILNDWSLRTVSGVPFTLIDPQGTRVPNAIVLHTPHSAAGRLYPQTVQIPCNSQVARLHLLGGISGWGYPSEPNDTVSVIVQLRYDDGAVEQHELLNGRHIADYIARRDVPESEFAFMTDNGRQVRWLTVEPQRDAVVRTIEFVKGPDKTSPVFLAVTVERP